MVGISIGMRIVDGLSPLGDLLKAMSTAGCSVLSSELAELRSSDLVKVVSGAIDGEITAVTLPSATLLRFLASEIERL